MRMNAKPNSRRHPRSILSSGGIEQFALLLDIRQKGMRWLSLLKASVVDKPLV